MFAVALVFDASALIKVVINGDGIQRPEKIAVIREGYGAHRVQLGYPIQLNFGDITLNAQPTINGTSLSFTNNAGVDYKCLVSHGVVHLSPEFGHTSYFNQPFSFSSEEGIVDDQGIYISITYDNMMFTTLIGNEAPAMLGVSEEDNDGKLGTKEKVIRETVRIADQVKEVAQDSGKKIETVAKDSGQQVERAGREVRRFFRKW